MLPILLLWMLSFTLILGYMLFFCGWCRRYAAHFTAVDAVLHTAARVNAAPFSAVGVGVVLPTLLLLVLPFTLQLGYMLPLFLRLV